MNLPRFPACVLFAAAAVTAGCTQSSADKFDLIVRGGRVVDGAGQPPTLADVGIVGDRIARIGDLTNVTSGRTIDASGLIVSPGFIDVQGQSGTTLLADGNGEGHLRQGITSEIIGEAGSPAFWIQGTDDSDALKPYGISFDWTGFTGYFDRLRQRGTTINLGTFVPGHHGARATSSAWITGRQPRTNCREWKRWSIAGMRDGAFGLSSALIYVPGTFRQDR